MSIRTPGISSRKSLQIKRDIEERIRSVMREPSLICGGTKYRLPKNRNTMIDSPVEPLPSPSGPDPMLDPWCDDETPTPTSSPSPHPTHED